MRLEVKPLLLPSKCGRANSDCDIQFGMPGPCRKRILPNMDLLPYPQARRSSAGAFGMAQARQSGHIRQPGRGQSFFTPP